MARLDPHSYADTSQPTLVHLDWKAKVDFDAEVLDCSATLTFDTPSGGPVDLDTRGLTLLRVADELERPVPYELHAPEPILGQRLRVQLAPGTRRVRMDYRTAKDASALQWLAPEQTAGGRRPFL